MAGIRNLPAIRSLTARPGPALALLSAALFGASTPCAKLFLGAGINPWLLAGLLYLGSGLGLLLVRGLTHLTGRAGGEAPLRASDFPWLALVVLCGGVAGPVLLMYGLSHLPATSAALLLNLEAVFTLTLAYLVFREHVDRRLIAGAGVIIAGAVLLAWPAGSVHTQFGALAIIAACFAWGLDNNLTRKLSAVDPLQIAMIKGMVAGGINLALALWLGSALPTVGALSGALGVGFFGYGASLVLFMLALRHLGAGRTGAYFSTAPFMGALLALPVLGESLTPKLLLAGALMAIGVYLHLSEVHEHEHAHEALAHEHRHRHDEHHRHAHGPDDPTGEPHSHRHTHAPLVHAHAHYPDLHHRHGHGENPGDPPDANHRGSGAEIASGD